MSELTQTQEINESSSATASAIAPKKKVLKRSKTLGENAPQFSDCQRNGVTKEYIKKLLKEIEEEDDSVILKKKDREVIRQCDKDLVESENEVKQNKNHLLLQIISNLDIEDYDTPINDIMDNYGAVIKYLDNRSAETAVMKWQMDDYWMVKLFHKDLERIVKQFEEFRSDILMSLN
jgi:hypothetical protein